MTREPSTYVCAVCGLAVYSWRSGGWKHAASGTTGPSCGQRPDVIERETWEKEAAALRAALNFALRHRLTGRE